MTCVLKLILPFVRLNVTIAISPSTVSPRNTLEPATAAAFQDPFSVPLTVIVWTVSLVKSITAICPGFKLGSVITAMSREGNTCTDRGRELELRVTVDVTFKLVRSMMETVDDPELVT